MSLCVTFVRHGAHRTFSVVGVVDPDPAEYAWRAADGWALYRMHPWPPFDRPRPLAIDGHAYHRRTRARRRRR